MRIALSDCSRIDQILPMAVEFNLGIEIQEFANPANIDNSGDMAQVIGDKIKRIPLRGFHGPFSELVPASRDTRIREVARSRYESAYKIAQVVGAQHLILHTGFIPKTYPREIWIENSLEFWKDFLVGKREGMHFHLENVYEDDYMLIAELVDRVNDALQDNLLSICVDIGHVHSNSSRSFEDWIGGLGRRIQYTHLHNNDGVFDNHWSLGTGKIDIVKVLDLLIANAPDAVWTIETISDQMQASILWLLEKGYLK